MEKGARQDIVELLGGVPLFSELSPEELQRVAQVAIPRRYPGDTRVFHEGDPGDACYIVQHGSCRVIRQHSDGRVITLATLGPGAIFGELAMLDGERRSASIEAVEDTELLALPATDMRALIREHPEMAEKLVVALTRRLREANERIARQSFQTVPSRVAGVLNQLLAEEGVTPLVTRRRDDQAAAVGSRPDGRDLPRERQPVPRHARAGRSGAGRPGPGDGDRARAPRRLHLLAAIGTEARRLHRRNGPGWSSASCAGAASTTNGCSPRWPRCRASISCPTGFASSAYNDSALPIGHDQTISQPWVVAAICQALRLGGDENVLEIGTGSGYSAAVLANLASQVISIERVPELGEAAAVEARGARYRERGGDRRRWQPRVPGGRALRRDRGPRGHPRGARTACSQSCARTAAWSSRSRPARRTCSTAFVRQNGDLRQETIGPCRFVPLIGVEGFNPPEPMGNQ